MLCKIIGIPQFKHQTFSNEYSLFFYTCIFF